LKGIRSTDAGLEIGAGTTLTEVVRHPVVKEKYGILLERRGGSLAADPQSGHHRKATSHRTRAAGLPIRLDCYRAGGNICYADSANAINREHAIFDADRCVAVSPSIRAGSHRLDAKMVIRNRRASGSSTRELLHRAGIDITRMNVSSRGTS